MGIIHIYRKAINLKNIFVYTNGHIRSFSETGRLLHLKAHSLGFFHQTNVPPIAYLGTIVIFA